VRAPRARVSHDASYRTTLIVKLVVVVISGLTAALFRGVLLAG
jgi:hypothetical protein